MNNIIELRQLLHKKPELSGNEKETAEIITSFLNHCSPTKIISQIGGHGVAAEFESTKQGKRVLVRCELDALPQTETLDVPYSSDNPNAAHKCGHDGHMAIVAGVAEQFHKHKLEHGSLVLLFQPAEETGAGATLVLKDRKFSEIEPDYVIALHNLPGFDMHEIILRKDTFASASEGIHFHFEGKTSHAAEPQNGNSPAMAVAQLIQTLSAIPQMYSSLHDAVQVTVVQASVGEIAYGTSPGVGDVRVTIRAYKNELLHKTAEFAISYAEQFALMYNLKLTTSKHEYFPETKNDSKLVDTAAEIAKQNSIQVQFQDHPFAWSEDFGNFTNKYPGLLFGLGSGKNQSALHNPEYDFPDELISTGLVLFEALVRKLTRD